MNQDTSGSTIQRAFEPGGPKVRSPAFLRLAVLIPLLDLLLGARIYQHLGQLSTTTAGVLVLVMLAIPLPWVRGLFYNAKVERQLQQPGLSEDSNRLLREAIHHASIVLAVTSTSLIVAVVLILGLMEKL